MESKHSLLKSFQFAFEGIKVALLKGRNFRIQLGLGLLSLVLGLILRLAPVEWAILTVTITSVLILELINTALESIVNIVSPEIRNEAKIAKDVAAATVLIAAIGSILVGAFLFLPKLV